MGPGKSAWGAEQSSPGNSGVVACGEGRRSGCATGIRKKGTSRQKVGEKTLDCNDTLDGRAGGFRCSQELGEEMSPPGADGTGTLVAIEHTGVHTWAGISTALLITFCDS